jgi:hypothetical protein
VLACNPLSAYYDGSIACTAIRISNECGLRTDLKVPFTFCILESALDTTFTLSRESRIKGAVFRDFKGLDLPHSRLFLAFDLDESGRHVKEIVNYVIFWTFRHERLCYGGRCCVSSAAGDHYHVRWNEFRSMASYGYQLIASVMIHNNFYPHE